ncbi:MAG: TolC family protein [Bacteroidaceae bacterium]|nr:TolC family protein [Bacteroidaceae bacterium]
MKTLTCIILLSASMGSQAQERLTEQREQKPSHAWIMPSHDGQGRSQWTAEQCIQYAVTQGHSVRMQAIYMDDCKTEKARAIGSFLPSVNASMSGQYNFGRAIDPQTNTYTNVSTFYNSYGLSAQIPIFDGLQRYNDLRASQANLLMGRSRQEAQKDMTAQAVLYNYMQVLYCKGSIEIATQKRSESEMLLKQTKVMAEMGRKSEADVAQMQATYAADDYEVTHQQGLYDKALLALKQQMNYPADKPLLLCAFEIPPTQETTPLMETDHDIYAQAKLSNPEIKQAEYSLLSARYAYRSSKGALLPSISLGAGISTTYYKQLNAPAQENFRSQFRNNTGEYIYASLSLPIFNRLNTISNIRRQRNNVRKAEEELAYQTSELQRLIMESITNLENSRRETEKMKQKVEADSIASKLTTRKYEEGLASPIDVQTGAVTLMQSKAQLLQSQLKYIYNSRILNYYKGTPLWTE